MGDIKNVIQGENRAKNIIMYTTPKMNGLSATVAFVPNGDEDDGEVADSVFQRLYPTKLTATR